METLTIKLKWENNVSYEMTVTEGDKTISIVKVEENGHIETLWPHIQNICNQYFQEKIEAIGVEMAQL